MYTYGSAEGASVSTMKSTIETIEGNLPTSIVTLNEAKSEVSDDTLDETIGHAMTNGYVLCDISEHDLFGVEYTLEKVEVE